MVVMLSMMSVASGAFVSCCADSVVYGKARAELCGGALLVLGFALIGTGLPLFR